MDRSEEQLIKRFVRRPERLSVDEQEEAERLLGANRDAALYAKFLQGFYGQRDEDRERPLDPHIGDVVDPLFGAGFDTNPVGRPSVIPVESYEPDAPARPTVLAAETDGPSPHHQDPADAPDASDPPRFSVLTVLASADEQMLVRVVGDQESGRGHLSVMAESEAEQAHVVVSFPKLDLDLVTDAEGRATFSLPPNGNPEDAEPEAASHTWGQTAAVVRRPVATRRLADVEETVIPARSSSGPAETSSLFCRREGKTLTVTPDDVASPPPPFLSVTTSGHTPLLLSLRSGSPVQQAVPTGDPLTLHLYE